MKICTKCLIEKDESEFHKKNKSTDALRSICKICFNNDVRDYKKKNKNIISEKNKIYNSENKEKISEYHKNYYKINKEKISEQKKVYYKNIDKKLKKERRNKYQRERLNSDIEYKILDTLRSRVNTAIRRDNGTKAFKTMSLLGCTIEELKNHLESLFQEGMSFDNHGEWHIDHIIPCTSFDLTDPEQQKLCFNWTNLQPLWAKENISKRNKTLEYKEKNVRNK